MTTKSGLTTRHGRAIAKAFLALYPFGNQVKANAKELGMGLDEYILAALCHSENCDHFSPFLAGWCEATNDD